MNKYRKKNKIKIIVISRSWPSDDRSGVSLMAEQHLKILVHSNYEVCIVGSFESIQDYDMNVKKYYVNANGSGALYSKPKIKDSDLIEIFEKESPDLVINESWQTALTDRSLKIANYLGIPVLMISHGISIHPYSNSFYSYLRFFAWIPYLIRFKNLMTKVTVLATLEEFVESNRFFDRNFANLMGIPCVKIVNNPINFSRNLICYRKRKKQILVIGYFSRVKNQLAAIKAIATLPDGFKMIFIGKKVGGYYQKCVDKVFRMGLSDRVSFFDDSEVDLKETLSQSLLLYIPSITELAPLSALEAMASGTPFLAAPVGALPTYGAGIIEKDFHRQVKMIEKIMCNKNLWQIKSEEGLIAYKKNYTNAHVRQMLLKAINLTLELGALK